MINRNYCLIKEADLPEACACLDLEAAGAGAQRHF
jgi:hypothetical protein